MTILNKEELLSTLSNEVRILKHLHSKITPGTENFRFGEKMRSTLELLQYLAVQGSACVQTFASKDGDKFMQIAAKSKDMKLEDFPAMIDTDLAEITASLNSWTEEQWNESFSIWGMPEKIRRLWIVDVLLAQFIAYRTQLFLQIKANGRPELNTYNLWGGIDGQM